MVLVCISHVHQHLYADAPELAFGLAVLTRVATPTFLLLSGFIAGYLLRSDATGRATITLLDRALFLLVVAHLLMGWAYLPTVTLFEWLFLRVTVPDAIGYALCIAVLLRNASCRTLVLLGASVFLASWIIAMTAQAETPWMQQLGALLFTMHRADAHPMIEFALVPYLAIFILGMALSAHLHRELASDERALIARRLIAIGSCGVAIVLLAVLTWHSLRDVLVAGLETPTVQLLRRTLNPTHKWPPSPAYLLFYGGVGALMAGVFFLGRPAFLLKPLIKHASVIGRASLMSFIVQDWLLFVAPVALGFDEVVSAPFWLLYCAAAVLILYVLARAWGRIHGNRFLTVGLRRVLHRAHA